MRAALEEPQDGDVVSEAGGIRVALHKGICSKSSTIAVDYSESGFTASFEQQS